MICRENPREMNSFSTTGFNRSPLLHCKHRALGQEILKGGMALYKYRGVARKIQKNSKAKTTICMQSTNRSHGIPALISSVLGCNTDPLLGKFIKNSSI